MLILIRGPAAAGKSEVARILQKRLGENTALIEMDKIYYEVLQNDVNHNMVMDCVSRMADTFMSEGYNVIVEGVMTVPYDKQRKKLKYDKLLRLAKKHKTESKIFFLDLSLDAAYDRDKERYGEAKNDIKTAQENERKKTSERDNIRRDKADGKTSREQDHEASFSICLRVLPVLTDLDFFKISFLEACLSSFFMRSQL